MYTIWQNRCLYGIFLCLFSKSLFDKIDINLLFSKRILANQKFIFHNI